MRFSNVICLKAISPPLRPRLYKTTHPANDPNVTAATNMMPVVKYGSIESKKINTKSGAPPVGRPAESTKAIRRRLGAPPLIAYSLSELMMTSYKGVLIRRVISVSGPLYCFQ